MPSESANQMLGMMRRLDEINDYDDPVPNAEADALRDEMDVIWRKLSSADREWLDEEIAKIWS